MYVNTLLAIISASLAVAAPVASPEVFQRDSVESSYDVKREFNPDKLLQISKDSVESSYDVKREFNPDKLLQISKDSVESSYDV